MNTIMTIVTKNNECEVPCLLCSRLLCLFCYAMPLLAYHTALNAYPAITLAMQ